jgi:hypothetical protein
MFLNSEDIFLFSFPRRLQMFQNVLLAVGLVLIGYVLYPVVMAIVNKYYYKNDGFQNTQAVRVNTPGNAPLTEQAHAEPPRVVSQAGPNPPNVRPPVNEPSALSPEEKPNDPYDETNSELPLKGDMRQPERSFGPGVANTGTQRSVSSGTAADAVNASLSSFSPEFAQNGGNFMEGISANDMSGGSEYATL